MILRALLLLCLLALPLQARAALVVADRVNETSTTTGTGSLALLGATSNHVSFTAAVGVGNTTYYAIVARAPVTQWEVGLGTLTGASTLARTTPYSTWDGTTLCTTGCAALAFSAGTKDVFVTNPARTAGTTITGTANQIIASAPAGAVTLSLPQSIATASTPTFGALLLSATPAAAGTIRLPTAFTLTARNAANSADLTVLATDASNQILLAGNTWANTSGSASGLLKTTTFAPTSGNFAYAGLQLNPTVNATGSTSGAAFTSLALATKLTSVTGTTVKLFDFGSTTVDYFTGYTSRLSMDAAGQIIATYRLLVGATAVPVGSASTLAVVGGGGAVSALEVYNAGSDSTGMLVWGGATPSAGTAIRLSGSASAAGTSYIFADYATAPGALVLGTYGTRADHLALVASGNVGIGITAPTAALHVSRGTTATGLLIDNTYTNASEYERLNIGWAANLLTIATTAAGTGTVRNIALVAPTFSVTGAVLLTTLQTTGAAAGKSVVCVDVSTGRLYASSTDVDCSN